MEYTYTIPIKYIIEVEVTVKSTESVQKVYEDVKQITTTITDATSLSNCVVVREQRVVSRSQILKS
jgi:hypothetical protein